MGPQKRCLNCNNYEPDEKDLEDHPISPTRFGIAGVCIVTGKRVMDGWSCGAWTPPILDKQTKRIET